MNDYWTCWQKLLEAAMNLQKILPGAVLVGGTAAAVHLQHRFSFDADHVLQNLDSRYAKVIDLLEANDGWKTARITPPKLILGNFQGVATGLRQLMRTVPLETETVEVAGTSMLVPTKPEMLRIKGWMIVSRNMLRDYIDFAALAENIGSQAAAERLLDFDRYYEDLYQGAGVSPKIQLMRQLADPMPADKDQIDIANYKGIQPPFDNWEYIREICLTVSTELGLRQQAALDTPDGGPGM